METTKRNIPMIKFSLLFNSFLLLVGSCSGSLINRLYFIQGGKRIWLSGWLQAAGCPILLIPLAISYLNRPKNNQASKNTKLFLIKPSLFASACFIGLIFGVIEYLYGFGSSKLPISTGALIYASQLGFTAGFAFVIVKQKFTPYSINSVVLLTVGSAVLALNAGSDRPEGESKKEYIMGFLMMGLAAVIYGLVVPLIELAYMKANQNVTYTLAMEFDLVMCLSATAFSTVGMLVNDDFKAIGREATEFGLGEVMYYILLVFDAIAWQCYLLGLNGVIFCASSLFSGILGAVSIPITEFLAVIFLHEKFQAQKGVCLVLSIWGFVSYFFGEINNDNLSPQVATLQVANVDKSFEAEDALPIHH